MKNLVLVILFSLISLVSFSQKPNFKVETTLENDGSITKNITVFKDPLMSYATLKAKIVNTDTLFYFVYKDQQYTHIISYQSTQYLTKDEVINIFKSSHLIKDKVVDNAKCGNILVSKGPLKSIIFYGEIGWGSLNLSMTETNFNYFINE